MKLYAFFALALVTLTGISCLKGGDGCSNKTPASEAGTIQAYCTAQGITATQHSSGLFYQIINPGSGPTPNANSVVSVRYTGKFLDGTVFDSRTGTPLALGLSNLIQGWQIGLPLLQKGGSIKMVVPSALAYGCQGAGTIPANTIVYFEIDLVDVQ